MNSCIVKYCTVNWFRFFCAHRNVKFKSLRSQNSLMFYRHIGFPTFSFSPLESAHMDNVFRRKASETQDALDTSKNKVPCEQVITIYFMFEIRFLPCQAHLPTLSVGRCVGSSKSAVHVSRLLRVHRIERGLDLYLPNPPSGMANFFH